MATDVPNVCGVLVGWRAARLYPDQVSNKRSVDDDRERLEKYVYPAVQDIPKLSFTRAHAGGLMTALPTDDAATGDRRRADTSRR